MTIITYNKVWLQMQRIDNGNTVPVYVQEKTNADYDIITQWQEIYPVVFCCKHPSQFRNLLSGSTLTYHAFVHTKAIKGLLRYTLINILSVVTFSFSSKQNGYDYNGSFKNENLFRQCPFIPMSN